MQEDLLPDIALVCPNVANLWRLQAQAGVFLYVPTNWEAYYSMDRIVFPYSGYPSFPSKCDVYPDRKSQLEILLDQFFDNERKLEGVKKMREFFEQISKNNPDASWYEMENQPSGYNPKYIKSEEFESHQFWQSIPNWLVLTEEHHAEVWRRDVPIALDFSDSPSKLASRFASGARRAMERDQTLRKHSVTWKIETTLSLTFRSSLTQGHSTLWDGLRSLPFDDTEVAQSLGNWLALYALDFDMQGNSRSALSIFSQLFGPSIRIEFGTPDGSSAIGLASIAGLQASLRPDLAELFSDEFIDRLDDIEFLLQTVTSPERLFDFRQLANLFATQIVPSQMIRPAPVFFHPARLKVLGLP